MGSVVPSWAPVRPRVSLAAGEEPRLLEDIVAELADERPAGVAWIIGKPRSGKTTALCHLAAVFDRDERFTFVDEDSAASLPSPAAQWVIAASGFKPRSGGVSLALADWRCDELIEYLLSVHRDVCASVIGRLGPATRWPWTPDVARIVLERFAADPSLTDPTAAILDHVRAKLANEKYYRLAQALCLSMLVPAKALSGARSITDSLAELSRIDSDRDVVGLLFHDSVQLALAAERVLEALSARRSWRVLKDRLPRRLVQRLSEQCRHDGHAIEQLQGILASRRTTAAHPMAASLLHAADIGWRPDARTLRTSLAGGYFVAADWPHAQLRRTALDGADFTQAMLNSAMLDEASLVQSIWDEASLSEASLRHVSGKDASFVHADLRSANLASARLEAADFSGADLLQATLVKATLKGANLFRASLVRADLTLAYLVGANLEETDFSFADLRQADLTGSDLRTACLEGADFEKAWLPSANLEDVEWPAARLREADLCGAHLTGSHLPDADLRGASLREAGLGEIDWERAKLREADLRGATFHMCSSRSGLVNSPIACEGSRTGFYTDELEEVHFRPPEEVRKANLRGADLRGAKIDNVDFYLVDLREARLDAAQFAHARRTGAILDDENP